MLISISALAFLLLALKFSKYCNNWAEASRICVIFVLKVKMLNAQYFQGIIQVRKIFWKTNIS